MAAMTKGQEQQLLEQLLEEVKNYLDRTWNDDKEDDKLLGMIKRGMAAISGKIGACDFKGETQEKALLFQLIMYESAGELPLFWMNYKADIIGLQVDRKVEEYAKGKEQTV